MANNYCQGTVAPFLPLTQEHKDLIDWDPDDSVLDSEGNWITDEEHDPEDEARAELDRLAMKLGMTEEYKFGGHLGYERHVRDPEVYYLYCEEGLGGETAVLLQYILQGLDKNIEHIQVEGASTCSKLRPGEFGGWACHITRDDIKWYGTGQWLREQALTDADKLLLEKAVPGFWDDDPDFPSEDWRYEIANEDTRLGYHEWCAQQRELKNEGADDDLDG